MSINIKVLEAYDGDCILIRLNSKSKKYNVLIDGGEEDTYDDVLKEEILNILSSKDENIDLLVITHIDDDHIGGIKALFEDNSIDRDRLKEKIKEVWFNSAKVIADYVNIPIKDDINKREIKIVKDDGTQISKDNANSLEKELKSLGFELNIIKKSKQCRKVGEMNFIILSPTDKKLEALHKEWPVPDTGIAVASSDYSLNIDETIKNDKNRCCDSNKANGASIAFILEFEKKKLLMLGDAHNSVIKQSLIDLGYGKNNKLKVDLMKISHHASNSNTSKELIEMIDCEKYIISSDGSRRNVPGKKCLSRIIKYSMRRPILYFNYDIVKDIFGNEYKQEQEKHKFKCLIIKDSLEV